jgi:hypothetical protein
MIKLPQPNCPSCGEAPRVLTMITCINKKCDHHNQGFYENEWKALVKASKKGRDASKRVYSDE